MCYTALTEHVLSTKTKDKYMEFYQATNNVTGYKFICTNDYTSDVYKLKKITQEEVMDILWKERKQTYPIDYKRHEYELDIIHTFVQLKLKG